MEDKLKSLVDQGKTIEVISKEMGISLGSVKRKIKSLGLKTKNAIKMRDEYNTTPIEKKLLEDLISSGNSLRKISKIIDKSLSSVRYWVDKYEIESGFKKFSTKEYGETKFCPRCQENLSIDKFHDRRGKKNGAVYCKSCTTIQTLERMRTLKSKMIEYKGGKCVRCGYDKYQGALEFHHINPDMKDFNPSHLRKYSFDERIKEELDKCILVCSNCHREIHHEIIQEKYKSKKGENI